jgi:NAD(P)-dependent dehydrogenase (short-subunit alcohol dehydrogenase family)
MTAPQVAVVTGAARGIGRAIATRFVERGFVVHACDIADNAWDPGFVSRSVYAHRCDVADVDQVAAFAQAVATHTASIDGEVRLIVNNSAVNLDGGLLTTSDDVWDLVLRTNLFGVFYVTRALLPLLVQPGGVVITIASDQSRKPKPGKLAYGVSKAAVAHLARLVALEHAPGIRSLVVSPGPVDTDMLRQSVTAPDPSAIPLRRVASPDEVAGVVEFLASDAAGYITGINLSVDGGLVAT